LLSDAATKLALVALGPDGAAIGGIIDLRQDPQAIPHMMDADFDDGVDIEAAGHLADVDGMPLELERTAACDNFDAGKRGQGVTQLIGQGIPEAAVQLASGAAVLPAVGPASGSQKAGEYFPRGKSMRMGSLLPSVSKYRASLARSLCASVRTIESRRGSKVVGLPNTSIPMTYSFKRLARLFNVSVTT